MPVPLRVLIVEDNPDDAELVILQLREAGFAPDWRRVETEADYLAALDSPLDLILSDWSLPRFSGLRALRLYGERDVDAPFIIVSGAIGEEAAIDAVHSGADDYVLKDRPARLGESVHRALEGHRLRTERRQAEEALRESEQRFRTVFENSSAAMAIIERDTTISMVNKAYCEMSLYEKQDVVGTSWTSQIPPEDLERLKEYNRRRLTDPNNAPAHYEFSFFRKDGEVRHALISVAAIPATRKFVASFVDITERRQAEAALRESEARFKHVFDYSVTGISVTSISGETHCNPALCDMLGYSVEEMEGRTWREITHPDDFALTQKMIDTLLSAEVDSVCFSKRFVHKSGSVVWVDMGSSLRRGPDGAPEYFITTVGDITVQRQAEKALRQLAEELQARNDALSRFNQVAVGRELRMVELKREVNELCEELGRPPLYRVVEVDTPLPVSPQAQA